MGKLFFFLVVLHSMPDLVPQPGFEPVPPAVEMWIPNHWTTREVPGKAVLRESQSF